MEDEDLPSIPDDPDELDERRVWIGNLDTRITEFTLVKILQKYGKLIKFDFLVHKTGPDRGKPRGYCFVTFSTEEESQKAIKSLNGKVAGQKRLVVKKAHRDKYEFEEKMNPFLARRKELESKRQNVSPVAQIRAIEAQLKMLQGDADSPAAVTDRAGASQSSQDRHTDSQREHHTPRGESSRTTASREPRSHSNQTPYARAKHK